jgi:hypothetical protein
MERAEKILEDHIDGLHRLANALLEREIMDIVEIDKALRGEALPPLNYKRDDGEARVRTTEPTDDERTSKSDRVSQSRSARICEATRHGRVHVERRP